MMSEAQIKKHSDGDIKVSGTLGFGGVVSLLDMSREFFAGQEPLVFDLAEVGKVDSAGLALLIEWMCMAEKSGQSISFQHLPKQLIDIAQVSGLDEVLPVV